MFVRDVMVAPVITVTPSTTVKEVAEKFRHQEDHRSAGNRQP